VQSVNVAGGSPNDPVPFGDTWVIKLNTGAFYPEETFTSGRDVAVVRGGNAATGRTAQFTLMPGRIAYTNSGCGATGVCPHVAEHLIPGYLEGTMDDAGFATDPAYKSSLHDFDLSANIDWLSSPMQLDYATNTIKLDVSNAHFEPDGTTVFHGHVEFTLPNSMLTSLYNLDDPSSLGVIRSTGSLKRGSKVRGYQATCATRGHTITATSTLRGKLQLRVRGLHAGKRYRCTVRARSHAGLGIAGHVTISAAARRQH